MELLAASFSSHYGDDIWVRKHVSRRWRLIVPIKSSQRLRVRL